MRCCFRDGTIQVRLVADDSEVVRFNARSDRELFVFGFSPDGRYLATRDSQGHALTVWDIEQRRVCLTDPGYVTGYSARFSPDSRRIALAHLDGELLVYDLATQRASRRRHGPGPARDLSYRSDGARIAVVYTEKQPSCQIIEADSGKLIRSIALPALGESVAWSPDGAMLATPCEDRKIYLWDAATGIRRATLEGSTSFGLRAAFHPAGTLLASNGLEEQTRFWDPVLGRPVLSVISSRWPEFNKGGRIVIAFEDNLTGYEVDPALEYRTFAHVSSEPIDYHSAAVQRDGRLLAAGTNRGVAIWDLALGRELAFLPIGSVLQVVFEASGDLVTSGSIGVRRWPCRLDLDRREFHIGPPTQLPLPAADCGIAEDRLGRIMAWADHDLAFVATPERTVHVGPAGDCRFVAVSPDGEWLATGSHAATKGAQVWRIRDAAKVADLPIDHGTDVVFSPEGGWLMTTSAPCRLWTVGTWLEARQIGGAGLCFSPDGRQMVVMDATKLLRLVECDTGRTLARLESPDLCDVRTAGFSPDGAHLVVTTNDGPAVHVWNLRAIRRLLVNMDLDWDAPAFSDVDQADPSALPLPPLRVDLGPLPITESLEPGFYEPVLQDLEAALARNPQQPSVRRRLVRHCNHFAWNLANAAESRRNPQRALTLARRAVDLNPNQGCYLNTLGVAQYRAGRNAEAIATLERSLAVNRGEFAAFDLFFLAMAHHLLGDRAVARECFDRAVRWLSQQKNLSDQDIHELASFRAEAQTLLDSPSPALPAKVFAPEPPDRP